MRGSKKNKRIKNKIYNLLELKANKIKKVRSYNIYRGITIENAHFRLLNQITRDKQIADQKKH